MSTKILGNEELNILRAKTPYSLPDNPSDKGFNARQIKTKFWEGYLLLFNWLKETQASLNNDFATTNSALLNESKRIDVILTYFSDGKANLAIKDRNNNIIDETYELKSEASTKFNQLISDIQSVERGSASTITGTQNINADGIQYTITLSNTQNANLSTITQYLPLATTLKAGLLSSTDKEKINNLESDLTNFLANAKAYTDEKLERDNIVNILGAASHTLIGLLSSEDKKKLDALYALLGEEADADTVVNTINEVLAIFSSYPEGVDIVSQLEKKVNYTDVINTLDSEETSKPLSAKMGKELKTEVDTKAELAYVNEELDKKALKSDILVIDEAVNNVNGLLNGEIMLDMAEGSYFTYRDSENNLIATYYASKSALSQANKEIANLKEVLYGYVLDSTDVEINSAVPYTTTIGSNTYNLVDNVYGLVKEVKGNTIKSENLCSGYEQSSGNTWNARFTLVNLKPNTTYYFKTNISGAVNAYVKLQNMSNQDVEVYHNQDYNTDNNAGFTFTTGASINGTYKLYTQFNKQTEYHNKTADQVQARCYENRSGLNTDYRPYFTGLKSVEYNGLKVNGTNLLNIADKTTINVTSNSDILALNLESETKYTCWLKFKVNSYSNSEDKIYSNIAGGVSSVTGDIVDSDKITISVGNTYLIKFTFTTPSTFKVFQWRLLRNSAYSGLQVNADILEIGVFKGTIDTFKPYIGQTILNNFVEPIFLRGVGTAKDKLVITKNEDNEFYTATSVSNTGYIRLGSMKWSLINDGAYNIFLSSAITDIKAYNENVIPNLLTNGNYTLINTLTGASFKSNDYDKKYTIRAYQHDIMVQDASYTDATSFKNAINDLWMVYELATPTSEVISTTLTDSDVMPLLELGGTVEIVGEDGELGRTVVEMVYRLSNTGV